MTPRKKHATDTVTIRPPDDETELFARVRAILSRARTAVFVVANSVMVEAYWNVGREIVEKQGGAARAKYGDGLIKSLSIRLTAEFGEGFTASNLKYMRQVYLAFPNRHTLCDQLTWSHYRTLASVEDEKARNYYFGESVKSHWSVRDLKRQIDTQFYERLMHNAIGEGNMKALVRRESAVVKDLIRSPADSPVVKYTLNEHECNLFAVKYLLHLPTVESSSGSSAASAPPSKRPCSSSRRRGRTGAAAKKRRRAGRLDVREGSGGSREWRTESPMTQFQPIRPFLLCNFLQVRRKEEKTRASRFPSTDLVEGLHIAGREGETERSFRRSEGFYGKEE